tara:strand:+ start:38 stop:235 length:198 start_codon:yes stop_codon:yes gene_type:complete
MFTTAGAADFTNGANESIVSAREVGTIFVLATEAENAAHKTNTVHSRTGPTEYGKPLRIIKLYRL